MCVCVCVHMDWLGLSGDWEIIETEHRLCADNPESWSVLCCGNDLLFEECFQFQINPPMAGENVFPMNQLAQPF